MAAHWLKRMLRVSGEFPARLLLVLLVVALPLGILAVRQRETAVTLHAMMPEQGGWLPDTLTAEAGIPLELHLISDDVMHGFAVGQTGWPAVDVNPGQMTELTLTFAQPGTYTYYCTRWCGPNHWRMRGTIEVTGDGGEEPPALRAEALSVAEGEVEVAVSQPASPPLYVEMGLDIDAPHNVDVQLDGPPSAVHGAALDVNLPPQYLSREVYLTQPPFAVWQELRSEGETAVLTDSEVWDLVAAIWQAQTTDEQVQLGQTLYAQNCAACHGSGGAGDGVFGQAFDPASDFTDAQNMLGASTAVFDGKIRRGGMGTGMPYWGTIFTDEEIEALIAYLWTFQFPTPETGD
jgi:cytochrome c oxidase subunit 2